MRGRCLAGGGGSYLLKGGVREKVFPTHSRGQRPVSGREGWGTAPGQTMSNCLTNPTILHKLSLLGSAIG